MKQLLKFEKASMSFLKLIAICTFLSIAFVPKGHAQEYGEAMQEAEQAFKDLKGSVGEVNGQIEKVAGYYQQFRDCVSGSGDTGKTCQQYIDLLYNAPGAGIEVQDQVMDVKMSMEELLKRFEASGVYQQLTTAKETFSTVGTVLGDATTALEFANKFNPEGARGDPTRGLRLIGAAIGDAAAKLPYPMNRIFEGYAKAVENISGKLTQLQRNIDEARQGNLGGGFSSYADAQAYFENHFRGQGGRDTDLYFDVTSQFRLLGSGVQVFQNLIDNTQDYYIYESTSGNIGETGWLAPPAFKTVYEYFAALPDRSVIPPAFRVQRLVAQARTNPGTRIEAAKRYYQMFREAENQYNSERLLKAMNLWDLMGTLLNNSEDAFVGFWLLVEARQNEIQRIVDALTKNVYAEGTVVRETDTGKEAAPGESVVLNVDGGGTGQATTDSEGAYFVYTRGQIDSNFTIRAGQGDEATEESGRFYQRGFDNLELVLKKVEKTPIALTISPDETTLKIDESVSFTATAFFDDSSAADVTGMAETTWSPGSSFTATEAGNFVVDVSYMGLSAQATVTVEEEEETVCDEPSEVWDPELGSCRCNTEEGYEPNEELGKCVQIDEAIEEVTEGEELCDEEALAGKLAQLDEMVASGNRMAAAFQASLSKFMKEINDQNSNPCENNIIAAIYAEAKASLAEYEALVDNATSLSTDLILQAGLCPLEEIELDIGSILQKVSQLGQPYNQIEEGLADMQSQLQTFGCDEQDVSEAGETIAERTDPEVIQAGGTGATETCGDGIDNDGDGLIDEGCEGSGNFNVIIVLFDSGNLADDVFGLSVTGQGNLGTTPEGGSRTYPLKLSPGSYVATVTVISAPDNAGTFTIRVLEGDHEIAAQTGAPGQGSVISVPFTIGDHTDASAAEAESILPMLLNMGREILQNEGN